MEDLEHEHLDHIHKILGDLGPLDSRAAPVAPRGRGAIMDICGYWFRLYIGYVEDTEFHSTRLDLSPQDVVTSRMQRMFEMLPQKHWLKLPLEPKHIPRAYHNYKGKCLQACGRGFSCTKPHSHEREVVAAARDPLLPYLSTCGRALRLALRQARVEGWTLWDPSLLPSELRARVSSLHSCKKFETKCGGVKCKNYKHKLSAIKIDAAQFFNNSECARAARVAKALF